MFDNLDQSPVKPAPIEDIFSSVEPAAGAAANQISPASPGDNQAAVSSLLTETESGIRWWQWLIMVVIILGLGLGGWWWWRGGGEKVNSTTPPPATVTAPPDQSAVTSPLSPEPAPETTTDSDGDGLTDNEEQVLGTNQLLVDSDSDGLFDGEEVKVYKTDPRQPDSDNDGYTDGEEIKNGYNPLGSGRLLQLPAD